MEVSVTLVWEMNLTEQSDGDLMNPSATSQKRQQVHHSHESSRDRRKLDPAERKITIFL